MINNNPLVIGAGPGLKLGSFLSIGWAFFITYATLPGVNSDLAGNTIGFIIVIISWISAISILFLAIKTRIIVTNNELIYASSFNNRFMGTRKISFNDISKIELNFSFVPRYGLFIKGYQYFLDIYNQNKQKTITIPVSTIDQGQFMVLIKEISNHCPKVEKNSSFLSAIRDNFLPVIDKLDEKTALQPALEKYNNLLMYAWISVIIIAIVVYLIIYYYVGHYYH